MNDLSPNLHASKGKKKQKKQQHHGVGTMRALLSLLGNSGDTGGIWLGCYRIAQRDLFQTYHFRHSCCNLFPPYSSRPPRLKPVSQILVHKVQEQSEGAFSFFLSFFCGWHFLPLSPSLPPPFPRPCSNLPPLFVRNGK